MRARSPFLFATIATCLSVSCATLPGGDELCPSLSQVAAQVGRGESSSVSVFLGPFDPTEDAIFPITCEHHGDVRWHSVCPTLLDHTSHEFIGIFAYQVRSCLVRRGRLDHVETRGVEIGLAAPRIVEADGRLEGVNLRLHELENQSGYEVTLSRPR